MIIKCFWWELPLYVIIGNQAGVNSKWFSCGRYIFSLCKLFWINWLQQFLKLFKSFVVMLTSISVNANYAQNLLNVCATKFFRNFKMKFLFLVSDSKEYFQIWFCKFIFLKFRFILLIHVRQIHLFHHN